MNITMDTDWGAKGAQLTGAQVQAFIKGQLQTLESRIAGHASSLTALNENMDSLILADRPQSLTFSAEQPFYDSYFKGITGIKKIHTENGILFLNSDKTFGSKFSDVTLDLNAPAKVLNIYVPNRSDHTRKVLLASLNLLSYSAGHSCHYVGIGKSSSYIATTDIPDLLKNHPCVVVDFEIYDVSPYRYMNLTCTFLPLQQSQEELDTITNCEYLKNVREAYFGTSVLTLEAEAFSNGLTENHSFIQKYKSDTPFWCEYKNFTGETPYLKVFITKAKNGITEFPFDCIGQMGANVYWCKGILTLIGNNTSPTYPYKLAVSSYSAVKIN